MERKISLGKPRVRLLRGVFACGAVITSLACPCVGQENVSSQKVNTIKIESLSLSEAISMAMDKNPGMRKAKESQYTSASKLKVAGINTTAEFSTLANFASARNDTTQSHKVLSEMTVTNRLGTQLSLGLSPVASGDQRGSIGLSLRHPLVNGAGKFSQKSNALAGAKLDVSIQEKQLYLTRQGTIQSIIQAYYKAVQSREQVKVQERAVETAQIAADGAKERAKERQSTEIEVSRAEMRVAQTKDQLNVQKQSAQGALDRLMIAIGEGIGANPQLTDAVPSLEIKAPSLTEALDKALKNRVELSIYDLQLADQERQLAMSQDKMRPKFDIVAGFNSVSPQQGLISTSIYNLGSFNAGLEYKMPLDKRALEEDRNSLARNLDLSRQLRVFQMEQVAESVRNAYRALDASTVSVEILGQNVKIAQDNLALAQEMLDEGLDDNRNVIEGQDALTKAESGLLSAKVDLFMSYVNLKYAMGEDLEELGLK